MKIFISHSSYDKWVARQISKELHTRGHKTFLDEKDIKTGDSIDSSIQLHLKDSDDLLVIISPVSLKSHWVFIEIGGAKALGKRIVPILFHIQSNEIPQAISSHLAKDLNDIDKYYLELDERGKPVPVVTPRSKLVPRRAKRKPRPDNSSHPASVEGFSVGDSVKVIDVNLLTEADKAKGPKWVPGMDKYSGAPATIKGFVRDFVILDFPEEYGWDVSWLRKG